MQAAEKRARRLTDQVSSLYTQLEASTAARDNLQLEANRRVAAMQVVVDKQKLRIREAEGAVTNIQEETRKERTQLQVRPLMSACIVRHCSPPCWCSSCRFGAAALVETEGHLHVHMECQIRPCWVPVALGAAYTTCS